MTDINRIYDILTRQVARCSDAEAAVDGATRLSYADLGQRVDRMSAALLAVGIGPGDRVATLAPPGLKFWVTYLAATSIGAIWLGLNPRYRERDYQYLLRDAAPRLVFCVSPYEERLYDAELQALEQRVERFVTFGVAAADAVSAESFLAGGAPISAADLDAARAAVSPGDTAVIVYTSGTTGEPKGAMLSHRAIAGLAQRTAAWMGDGLAKTIMPAPINHIGGLNNVCMNVFAHGGCIVFHHRVDPAELAGLIVKEQPSYLVTSPTAFIMFLEAPGFSLDLFRSFRLIAYGGAKTPKHVLEAYRPLGAYMTSVYGQTECCGIATRTQPDDPIEVMADTIGRPIDGTEIRVVQPTGDVPSRHGEVGELQLKADYLMSGYFKRPEATQEAFTTDGFLRTGDLAIERPDGNFELVGRIKEMFKSGGYNIYPQEIEQAICEHPGVSSAVVLSIPDPKFQEVGFAFVALKPGAALTATELRANLKTRIANFKVPKLIEVLDAMPLLPNSKIDRQALRRRLAGSFDSDAN